MSELAYRAVATLSVIVDELRGHERNAGQQDRSAVASIAAARNLVTDLRDRYAENVASAAIDGAAAQEILDLATTMEKLGSDSGSELAVEALEHEARRLTYFVMTNSPTMGVDGRFRFIDTK